MGEFDCYHTYKYSQNPKLTYLDLINILQHSKPQKKPLENRNIQRSKILLLLRRSQRSLLSRHRDHESLLFHLWHEIIILLSSETLIHPLALFRIEYLIPRELIRISKGQNAIEPSMVNVMHERTNLQLGTKVPIPVLVIWI